MKKIYFSMMALAIAACTFTSCEDVPEPYNNPWNLIGGGDDTPVVVDPAGSGTAEDPYNVAAIIEQTAGLADGEFFNNSNDVYVTGVVVETKEVSAQYGNATYYIADNAKSADRFYVYRGKLLDGASVAAETDLEVGDSVTVCGKIKNYKGTLEFDQSNYLTFIKKSDGTEHSGGSGSGSETGEGKGTADSPYNVTAAIAAASGTGVYVKGFIVGSIDGKATTDAKFSAETATASNILIATSADETDITKCMPVQLPTGAIRTALNLVDNAGNYKKEVTLYGNIEKYFSVTGIKSVTYAILGGTEIGKKPDGGSTGGDEIKTVTVAEFIAAPESTDVWYKITGTIKNLKDGDQYGNFDLEDATGSVYVYGLLSEKGGAKKKFQELVEKYGLANGSKITIIGNRGSYNEKIEVMNAYIFIEGSDTGGGETGADGSTIISVADFNAAAESTDVWYQLTGTIKNLKDGDQYGNFDLEDTTGSVYVYGVLSEKGGAKKKFQELVAAHGIANGKKITIVGNRGSYNNKIEVMNAYFIKVE